MGGALRRAMTLFRAKIGRREPARDVLEPAFAAAYERCKPFTMMSFERVYALHQAVEYIVSADVPGAIVECGVWRGGGAMLAALALRRLGDETRPIYLYDTFAGMSEPAADDVAYDGTRASALWSRGKRPDRNELCYAPREEVERNLASTGYPADRIVYVEGKVENTIPSVAPETIAILHLDTDWYASTYHELTHLFPRLADRAVLAIDDYGHWQGARAATDAYLAQTGRALLLQRVDYTGRMAVVPALTSR